MRLAQAAHARQRDLTTFVASDHGFAPQFLAIDASKVLVDLGLLSQAADLATAGPATGETIGKAKACWAGGAVQIYLNLAGRDPVAPALPAGPGRRRSTPPWRQIKAAFLALNDPNDWTGDGQPEGWKVIDRAYTKAEARYIPNGARQHGRHGAPDPHRRPGRVRLPAVPVRRRDAGHADRALGRSSASTATCRTCRTSRPTPTCGRRSWPAARPSSAARSTTCAASTSRRPPRTCSASRSRSRARASCGATCSRTATGSRRCRSSGSTTSTASSTRPTTVGDNGLRSASAAPRRWRRCSTRRRPSLPGPTLLLAAGDNVGASPPNSALLRGHAGHRRGERLGARRHVASATTSSTTASRGSSQHEARAHFPFLATNIVDAVDRQGARLGHAVDGLQRQRREVGVIGADRQDDAGAGQRRRDRRPDVPRRGRPASSRSPSGCARRASRSRSWSSTRAPASAPTRSTARRPSPGTARSRTIADSCRTPRSTS